MKTSNILIGVVVVAILGIAGWYFASYLNTKPTVTTQNTEPTTTPSSNTSKNTDATPSGIESNTKEFTVKGSSFKFEPAVINVKKGDTVKITFTNSGGMHDFVINEFNVKTKTLQSGQSEVVEFIADKTGSFEYYCSIGNHRAMGMKGTLIVE